jgi:hypothetical protein
MALDFPNAPTVGQKYPAAPITGVPTYSWDGEKWTTVGAPMGGKTPVWTDGSAAMTGLLTLVAPPVNPTDAAAKSYADTKVSKAGDTMSGPLTTTALTANGGVMSAQSATTGSYFFGNSGTKYLNYDGNNFTLNGGASFLVSGGVVSTGFNVGTSGIGATGDHYVVRNSTPTIGMIFFGNTNNKYLYYDGNNYNLVGGNLIVGPSSPVGSTSAINIGFNSAAGLYGQTFKCSQDNAYPIVFYNATAGQAGWINTTATTTVYSTSSDIRLKEDLKTFDAGRIIDATEVYNFKWKATGERSYGVSAQQANEVYPQAVTHNEIEDAWGIDYSKYVPLLLQELKALRARVAGLEGRLAVKPA